jgi:RHS repeat-associated protein
MASTLEHAALSRLEAIVDCHARAREVIHDRLGRVSSVRETGRAESHYQYDARGNVSVIADGAAVTRFEYDDRDRLVRTIEPGGTTTYSYGEDDRLALVDRHGCRSRFEHDSRGRLVRWHEGDADTVVYRYDEYDRVVEARTSVVSTQFEYDDRGRTRRITQARGGVAVTLGFTHNARGQLAALEYGTAGRVEYTWDEDGRPAEVRIGPGSSIRYAFDRRQREVVAVCSNGVRDRVSADPVDARPRSRDITRGSTLLLRRDYAWGDDGRMAGDGLRTWEYDELGQLTRATDGVRQWRYAYDAGEAAPPPCDERGRVRYHGGRVFRYNDRHELTEVLRDGVTVARFEYDHKSRVAAVHTRSGIRRHVYGPADELLAITDEHGQPVCLYVRTPFGLAARVRGTIASGTVQFVHADEQGTCLMTTGAGGVVDGMYAYEPYGSPLGSAATLGDPMYQGKLYCAEAGLYYFGARWYDPTLRRFLTPDSWTARPDDVRIVNAVTAASSQRWARLAMGSDWLRYPRARDRFAFCCNDPVGCSDPNGHWSFGGVLLSILGAIWTLPNTLLGLLIEITCLVGEVIRWLVWLVTAGNVSWATPGFDAAASGRLNAFALVFRGGWLGSFKPLLGITFGNVFFVYHDWENSAYIVQGDDPVAPTAYGGEVTIPRREAFYEHELRHTNQYAWFGPFYHLGLPIWGVYLWDVIFNGYRNAWLERDACAHGGI